MAPVNFADEDDIVATMPEQKEFQLAPEGVHLAICVSVIDLGTHEYEYKGKKKISRKVRIVFQLPYEKAVFKEDEGEQPFQLAQEFNNSLHPDSELRKALKAWRGRDFTEEELVGFSLKKILGKACQIQVSHTKNGEKTYADISAIMALGKGMEVPELDRDPTFVTKSVWETSDDRWVDLPEFIKKKIRESNEYAEKFRSEDQTVSEPHHNDVEELSQTFPEENPVTPEEAAQAFE